MIDYDWLTTALASADAKVQAEFLDNFCSSLVGLCKRNEGMQIWYIAAELKQGTIDLFKHLISDHEYHVTTYNQHKYDNDKLRKEEQEIRGRIHELEKKLEELDKL